MMHSPKAQRSGCSFLCGYVLPTLLSAACLPFGPAIASLSAVSQHMAATYHCHPLRKHQVWKPMYQSGFSPCIQDSPTTLKRECKEDNYMNHSIDNIYYDKDVITKIESGRIDFVGECLNLDLAREISDHLPVYLECEIIEN